MVLERLKILVYLKLFAIFVLFTAGIIFNFFTGQQLFDPFTNQQIEEYKTQIINQTNITLDELGTSNWIDEVAGNGLLSKIYNFMKSLFLGIFFPIDKLFLNIFLAIPFGPDTAANLINNVSIFKITHYFFMFIDMFSLLLIILAIFQFWKGNQFL